MQDPKLPGQCGQEDFDKVIRNYRVMKHEVKTWNQAPPFDMFQMLFDVGSFYKSGEIFGKKIKIFIYHERVQLATRINCLLSEVRLFCDTSPPRWGTSSSKIF